MNELKNLIFINPNKIEESKFYQLKLPENLNINSLKYFTFSNNNAFAILENNQVITWNKNNENFDFLLNEPVLYENFYYKRISLIFCNDNISHALTESGIVFSWGVDENKNGILGLGENYNQLQPVINTNFKNIKTKFISISEKHCCSLDNDNNIYTWGFGLHGELGLDLTFKSNIPTKIMNKNLIKKIGCGKNYTAFIDENNYLNYFGKILISNSTQINKEFGFNKIDNFPIEDFFCASNLIVIKCKNNFVYFYNEIEKICKIKDDLNFDTIKCIDNTIYAMSNNSKFLYEYKNNNFIDHNKIIYDVNNNLRLISGKSSFFNKILFFYSTGEQNKNLFSIHKEKFIEIEQLSYNLTEKKLKRQNNSMTHFDLQRNIVLPPNEIKIKNYKKVFEETENNISRFNDTPVRTQLNIEKLSSNRKNKNIDRFTRISSMLMRMFDNKIDLIENNFYSDRNTSCYSSRSQNRKLSLDDEKFSNSNFAKFFDSNNKNYNQINKEDMNLNSIPYSFTGNNKSIIKNSIPLGLPPTPKIIKKIKSENLSNVKINKTKNDSFFNIQKDENLNKNFSILEISNEIDLIITKNILSQSKIFKDKLKIYNKIKSNKFDIEKLKVCTNEEVLFKNNKTIEFKVENKIISKLTMTYIKPHIINKRNSTSVQIRKTSKDSNADNIKYVTLPRNEMETFDSDKNYNIKIKRNFKQMNNVPNDSSTISTIKHDVNSIDNTNNSSLLSENKILNSIRTPRDMSRELNREKGNWTVLDKSNNYSINNKRKKPKDLLIPDCKNIIKKSENKKVNSLDLIDILKENKDLKNISFSSADSLDIPQNVKNNKLIHNKNNQHQRIIENLEHFKLTNVKEKINNNYKDFKELEKSSDISRVKISIDNSSKDKNEYLPLELENTLRSITLSQFGNIQNDTNSIVHAEINFNIYTENNVTTNYSKTKRESEVKYETFNTCENQNKSNFGFNTFSNKFINKNQSKTSSKLINKTERSNSNSNKINHNVTSKIVNKKFKVNYLITDEGRKNSLNKKIKTGIISKVKAANSLQNNIKK